MRPILGILVGLTVLAAGTAEPVRGQDALAATCVVTYVEVLPGSAVRAPAVLREYRNTTRRESGNLAADLLQRRERENHFALLETWKDQASLDAHGKAPHVAGLVEALKPLQLAPMDQRLLREVTNSPLRSTFPAGAWYVITHADALPPAARGVDALKPLAAASRGENGNLRFDVMNQPSRQNHFTIVEVWESQQALDAHAAAAHTRTFREAFQAITGSLYDERLYKRID